MNEQIKEQIDKLTDSYVALLEKEYEKYIALQRAVEEELKKHRDAEELRRVAHEEALKNLKGTEEKTVQAKIRHNNQIDKLNEETSKYNALNTGLEKDRRQTKLDLEEAETLKKQAAAQLKKNSEIEKGYQDKMRHLKEDENRNEEARKAISARERAADIQEKKNRKGELRLAEDNIDLMERKDDITAKEERLKIRKGQVDA